MNILKKIFKKVKICINKFNSKKRNNRLKCKDFTIISNNCYAGLKYENLNLKFNSPTIGLYFYAPEYLKFIKNLKYYCTTKLEFISPYNSKYYDELKKRKQLDKIIGKIDDIEIVFLHYNSEAEAREKWEKRCKRINYNFLIYKFNDQNLCTYNDLKEFHNIDLDNKICFTAKKYEEFPEFIHIKKYKNRNYVKDDSFFNNKYLNFVNYINSLNKKKKITFCCLGFNKGGAERVISVLANNLSNENDVTIISLMDGESLYKLNSNISIRRVKKGKYKNKDKISFILLKKYYDMIIESNPDVIISFLPEPSLKLMILKKISLKIKKIPVIVSIRNDPKKEYSNKIIQKVMIFLYKGLNGLVLQTPEAKEYFDREIPKIKNSIVIPNPIDDKFLVDKPYDGIRKKEIVTVGRLDKQKNHFMLIDAFCDFHNKHNEFQLKIYGDGNLKTELQEYINSKKMSSSIHLMGKIDNVKEAIYDAAAFVLSSDYEGMPNALMEAMALGIPCISTNCPCGGPKYLISNKEDGLLFDVGNEVQLSDLLKYIVENEEIAKKIGKNSNIKMKNFDSKKITLKWEEYIQSVIEEVQK